VLNGYLSETESLRIPWDFFIIPYVTSPPNFRLQFEMQCPGSKRLNGAASSSHSAEQFRMSVSSCSCYLCNFYIPMTLRPAVTQQSNFRMFVTLCSCYLCNFCIPFPVSCPIWMASNTGIPHGSGMEVGSDDFL
jgi:hypothetical protein